ncbi:MAG: hypothetical protein HN474_09640 [Nitrospina sp.]|nr:hypothetical protein [Nitrospina sp.]
MTFPSPLLLLIDLIINDPPFGIGDDDIGTRYTRCEDNVIDGYVEVPVSKYEDFSYEFMVEVERTLRKGGSAYIFSGYQNLRHILNSAVKVGLEERNHIIWKYSFGLNTTKKFIASHYHLLYFVMPPISKLTFNEFMSDGDHTYEIVKQDILNFSKKLKSDGILCGHDCFGLMNDFEPSIINENLTSGMFKNSQYPGGIHPGVLKVSPRSLGVIIVLRYGAKLILERNRMNSYQQFQPSGGK